MVLKLKTARVRAPHALGAAAESDGAAGPAVHWRAQALLAREADGTAFRLIGIGAQPLLPRRDADRGDLADTATPRLAAAQAAIDALRRRFGEQVCEGTGIGLNAAPADRIIAQNTTATWVRSCHVAPNWGRSTL